MIRIIGGKYRHRMLKQPSLETTRCTKDAVKEGLFSSLGDDILNSSFLDLFSGSGSVGIEAYSRGAKKVVLNDLDKAAYNIIKENLTTLKINDIEVYNKEYKELLSILSKKGYTFNIVFLDPPYKMEFDFSIIDVLKEYNILNEKHIIIIERDSKIENIVLKGYKIKELKYGKTYIYILKKI